MSLWKNISLIPARMRPLYIPSSWIEPKMTKSGIEISGHALYALTSLMSHSCISNSKTIIKSDYSCECRATTLIPAGEEITKQVSSV